MQIKSIHLYSHDGRVRSINFKLSSLNVITGRKGTGKSALIRILEYCFGSGENNVPAGDIRDSVAWYAVLLSFGDSEMFIARAEPKRGARSSTKIYIDIGTSLTPPAASELEQNGTPESLIATLSQRIGIANIDTQRESYSTQEPYKITIAHALFFNFQRQDEIAKPTLLFHRQDEPFVDTHIRDVLPYFIGAMAEDRLLLVQRLRQERTELRRLEREIEALQPNLLVDPRADALAEEARAVGLIPRQAADVASIDLLRAVDSEAEPELNIEGLEQELSRRRNERDGLLSRQRAIRNRIEMLRALNREEVDYDRELDSQRARLKSVDLIRPNGSAKCPVCQQSVSVLVPSVAAMVGSIESLSAQLEHMTASRPKIEDTIASLETKASDLRREIQASQFRINRLETRTEAMRKHRHAFTASAVVRGRIQFFLESFTSAESSSDLLQQKAESLRQSVNELEAELSLENIQEQMDSRLRFIEDDMTAWSATLDLEYKTHVRLDPRHLTVVADTKNGPLPLSRMGSGANWMGYHVVTYAALHHWFEQQNRPVPRFIVFDQPTQVFYPPNTDNPLLFNSDDDQKRVEGLFHFLLELPKKLDNRVQVIVTDHALLDFPEFRAAIIENWHADEALIPGDWPRTPPNVEPASSD